MDNIIKKTKRFLQKTLGHLPFYHKCYLYYFIKGGFRKRYNQALKSQWLSASQFKSYQDNCLRKVIAYAACHVAYYRDYFRQLNLSPDQIRTTDDLTLLPVINKQTVVAQYKRFQDENIDLSKVRVNRTSGSSGKPLSILIDRNTDALTEALVWRHYNWAGCRFNSKSVYMGPPFNYEKGPIDEQNLYAFDATEHMLKINSALISKETLPELCSIIQRFKPDHIHAYPTLVTIFARYLLSNPRYNIRPKSIILRAEKVRQETRDLIDQAFDCACFELYCMWEYIALAAECEHHRLHLNPELGFVEILRNDGSRCREGETGQIVATGLHNRAMPLIRYGINDFGYLKHEPCACGRQMPTLEVEGSREKDLIITDKGYFNMMSSIPTQFTVMGQIEQIQFFQPDKENLIVRIVKGENYTPDFEVKIKNVLHDYLRHSVNISFSYVPSIPREKSGKYKYVDSRVKLNL